MVNRPNVVVFCCRYKRTLRAVSVLGFLLSHSIDAQIVFCFIMLASDIKDILGPSSSAATDSAAEFNVQGKEKTAATKSKAKTQKKKRTAVDALRIDALPVNTEDVVTEVKETTYQRSKRIFGKRYTRRWKKAQYIPKRKPADRADHFIKRLQQRFPDENWTLEHAMNLMNLSHWVPAGHPIEGQWAKPSSTHDTWPPYNDEEYDSLLVVEDWSREETDYLMRLAARYQFSFLVVTDRYDFHGKTRTFEEIKTRFHEIDSILKRHKNPTDNAGDYDLQRELTYREHFGNSISATRDELKEFYMLHLVMDAMQRAKDEPSPQIQRRCTPLVTIPASVLDEPECSVPKRMQEPPSNLNAILLRDTLKIPTKDEDVIKDTQNFLETMFDGVKTNDTIGMNLPCYVSPSAQNFAKFRDDIPRFQDLFQAYHIELERANELRAKAAALGLPTEELPKTVAPHKLALPVRTSSGESVPSFFARCQTHVTRLVPRNPTPNEEDTDSDDDIQDE